MAAWLDVCRYIPTAGSTTDWTFAAAVTGYQSPTAAGVVNGRLYKYRAESGDLTQWEVGEGAYNTGTGVLARTTVLFNNLGTTAKVNFTSVPQVAVVGLKEDLISIEEANSFSDAQKLQAASNISVPTHAGYFTFISSTLTQLQPFNGDLIKINGVVYRIGGGSISGANTSTFLNGVGGSNLAASTLYYVYLFNNSGTLTIDFSTTANVISTTGGNVGTIIKNGDDTRTLVGIVFTNASAQFQIENVISWFNKKNRQVIATGAATTGVTSQVEFCTWGDETIAFHLNISMTNGTASGALTGQLVLDGTATGVTSRNDNIAATGSSSVALSGTKALAAGHHTVAIAIGTTGTPSGAVEETYVLYRG